MSIVAAGNGSSTTTAAFARFGVAAPHDGVKSTVWPERGCWFTPASGRRWPVPCQVPVNEIRPTCIPPAASNPIEEWAGVGVCSSTPPIITIPSGTAFAPLKKSPFTPAATAFPETDSSSCVIVWRGPVTVPPPRTGPIVVRPTGAGAVITV